MVEDDKSRKGRYGKGTFPVVPREMLQKIGKTLLILMNLPGLNKMSI